MTKLMTTIDRDRSTVEIDGRVFPCCIAICPVAENQDEPEDEWARSIGCHANSYDTDVYIPTENGLLVEVGVTTRTEVDRGLLTLSFLSRRCTKVKSDDLWLWLPHRMAIRGDGQALIPIDRAGAIWTECYPDWVVEMIERWGGKPVIEPEGPEVKLAPLYYFGDHPGPGPIV